MKRHLVLGLGVVVAGLVALMATRSGHSPSVAANIGAKSTTDAEATAASSSVAAAPLSPAQRFLAESSEHAGMPLGDAHLRDVIDLADARLIDDAFYVDLHDGKRAVLTLDHVLQAAAESALAHAKAPKAAIVVMSVDGRILALAGRDGAKSAPDVAMRVWAPAASVFKVVTSAALVNAGVKPHDKVCYHGGLRSVTAKNLVDDDKRDHVCHDLAYALARSQNAIIAKLAHRYLQPQVLRDTAAAFSFGDAPPFALSMEPGRADIPESELDFAKVAAGFWQTELSPMGGALLAATIASGGNAVTPRIVSHVVRGDQSVAIEPVPDRRVLPEKVAKEVARMLVGTTEYGSARKGFMDRRGRRFLPDIDVAGKTGTLTRRAPSYMQYSWFVGFAPADDPEYVVSVLIGNGELWHIKAHTAARMVLQAGF